VKSFLLIPWFRYHPFDIELGAFELTVYPFDWMMWTGVVVTLVLAFLFANERDLSTRDTATFALFVLLFAFPVSKLFNTAFYSPATLRSLFESPGAVGTLKLGWSMYGGVLGGLIGAWLWKWRTGGSILQVGDAFAFAAPFGWCIGRIGCFLVHDHPGRVSWFPLAVADFQLGAPPWPPRHDLGLYEALALGSISVLFLVLARRPRPAGFYSCCLGLLYTPTRFFLDFLRASHHEGGDIRYAGLTPSQYVSVALLLVTLWVMRSVKANSASPS
jgi:phosphatidylglycerol:prolipoprotein diacylglycerol transferase